MKDKNISVGILAHVDSGKTTLSEAMLYKSGCVKKIGRVDHKDAFLDTHFLEKQRGITIFSKQAVIDYRSMKMFLLDTPGHVDFSAEMERTLKILDYGLLVVNGSGSIQSHTYTLWRLLKKHKIPTFVFVNKMDMSLRSRSEIIKELNCKLRADFVDFSLGEGKTYYENIASCDEKLMEKYLDGQEITTDNIADAIKNRKLVPVYFGSALKLEGIDALLNGIEKFSKIDYENIEDKVPSGKVFKISEGERGERLTHIKVTEGILHSKDIINNGNTDEKINQIRIYSGTRYEMVSEACKGMVVEVTGSDSAFVGMGFGMEETDTGMDIEPVLSVNMILEEGEDVLKVFNTIKVLNDEDPALRISWNNVLKEIEIKLMGEIQIEILKSIIKSRFNINVEFGKGKIIYKETIAEEIVGIGHYEPLRHYAEVHLLMKPLPRGEGIKVSSNIGTDSLDRNWQRLIETHIREKRHRGVLTGSEITDIEFIIVAGRAHKKHTEGGDFRQAVYRAVRQGLMKAESVLLEPVYEFELEIPSKCIGRAMMDLENMKGKFEAPVINGDMAVITGTAPVSEMIGYNIELAAYSKGSGRLITTPGGYEKCHNAKEIIDEIGYEPLRDTDNSPNSIFCANGAGYTVDYDRVEEFMHLTGVYAYDGDSNIADVQLKPVINKIQRKNTEYGILDKELKEIFERTYGKEKVRVQNNRICSIGTEENIKKDISKKKEMIKKEEYLLIDGYNVIFAWKELNELANENIDAARDKLLDILCNYGGIKNCRIMVVFDAYKVSGGKGSISQYHNIYVVYTKEAQTADAYIESFAHENAKNCKITVATSDGLEQIIIRGAGCLLVSSRELKSEIENTLKTAKDEFEKRYRGKKDKVYMFDNLNEDFRKYLEDIRLGKRQE